MLNWLKNYRDTLSLLGGVIIGGIVGLFMGTDATVLQPFGQLFLNLMYMVLIPLVFFSIANAIGQMSSGSRLGKILISTVAVFIFTAAVAAVVGYLGVYLSPLINKGDIGHLKALMGSVKVEKNNTPMLQQVVNMFTVDDFSKVLSKQYMLPAILFSLLFGIATSTSGKAAEPFRQFLASGNVVVLKIIKYIMYYAPFGLGCYFASIVGNLGSQIVGGYVHAYVLYIVLSIIYFFVIMTIYAFIAGGKGGVKNFWHHVGVPAVTAIATSSSAASIPANLEYTRKIGVPNDIVDTVIPLGANIHKDGSVIGGIFKVSFLFLLFGRDIGSFSSIVSIVGGGFFVGAVMGAIPGGGMVAETLIVSMFGFPTNAIPLLLIISTIIDIPATLLNSTGNVASAMMVTKLVDPKITFTEK
ncbi:dicarboxylate/amino acid:cation symporter [Lacticaseibacillus sharpeae]|uniref:Proton glutamate symport protein n=1 Tax=Lacticaseibacillus sharpeae JCM 1186 = DSM 20505 TaxID=1291052 RepID=A0A0R1ZNS4_9LACO|nr:dicarboxylate/amino acid:cation symporter [Lacticaseibacillus sharpeae]KRM56149.1 proton glutamate symport protein [Lacticaseibacillus sharpeae JCM 1186 = DSM 20505]